MKAGETYSDGRKSGEPHPDYEMNKQYLNAFLNNPEIKERLKQCQIQATWRGIKKTGEDNYGNAIYDVYTHVEFSWDRNGKLYADPLSLHTSYEKLREQVDKRFKTKQQVEEPKKYNNYD